MTGGVTLARRAKKGGGDRRRSGVITRRFCFDDMYGGIVFTDRRQNIKDVRPRGFLSRPPERRGAVSCRRDGAADRRGGGCRRGESS